MGSRPEHSRDQNRLGDFEIVREIGRGGMGVVYEARQVSLNRKVALKVLSSGLGLTARAVQRFQREAESAAKLHHTNIVPVYATGEQDGSHFYAMELIEGPSLDHVLRQLRQARVGRPPSVPAASEGPVPPGLVQTGPYAPGTADLPSTAGLSSSHSTDGLYFDTVARLVAEVADALEYAHAQGVIHRDIKPSNLLLSPAGRLSVNDFGLARLLEQPGMTMTGEFVGTPAYMSPEQITAGRIPLDHRSDIYSLGATLYELLTLEPPFKGQSREQVLAQIVQKEPLLPRKVNKRLPVDLETICLKALEKDPDRRYQTAGAMAEDLRRFVNRFAILARRAGPFERLKKWAKRHPGLTAGLACAWLAIGAAGYFAVQAHLSERQHRSEQEQQAQELLAEKRQNALEKALLVAKSGDLAEAEKAINEAEVLGTSPGQVRMLRGQVALDQDDGAVAVGHLEQAVKLEPASAAARALLTLAYFLAGQWDDYVQSLQVLERLAPVTVDDYLFKGRAEAQDDPARGLRNLEEAVRRLPGSGIARLARAEAQIHLVELTGTVGDAELAIRYANTAKDILPGNSVALATSALAHLVAASTFAEQGGQDRLRRELEHARRDIEALGESATQPYALVVRLHYFDFLGKGHEAALLKECRRAAEKTDHATVTNICAAILYRLGRFEEAHAVLHRRLPQHRGKLKFQCVRAFVLAELPDGQASALTAYQAAVRAAPDSFAALWASSVLRLLGHERQAVEACRRARGRMKGPIPWRSEWNKKLVDYLCGDLDADGLLRAARSSRWDQCEGCHYVALTKLAKGDRGAARIYFSRSVRTGVYTFFEHRWSRAFLARMDRDPAWPRWMPMTK